MIDIEFGKDKEFDNLLTNFYMISKDAMIEQSSKAGSTIREKIRAFFRAETTRWSQIYVKGKDGKPKRLLIKGGSRPLGLRVSHRNGNNNGSPSSMENFIQSYTSETTGTTTIGGMFKAYRPIKRSDGRIADVQDLGRQKGISRETVAILEKLNYGNTDGKFSQYLRWHRKKKNRDDKGYSKIIKQFEDKWKPRHFFEKGFSAGKAEAIHTMTTALGDLIAKRANNTDMTRER